MLKNTETATRPVRGFPFTRFLGDLNRKRLMLISTVAISPRLTHLGDSHQNYQLIPCDTAINDLHVSNRLPGIADMEIDLNCVFPLERLNEIADAGRILSATTNHISITGHNLVMRSVKNAIAPRIAELVEAEDAGGVILTGAGVLGHRIAFILQRTIEDRGIPTVTISQYPRLCRLYNVSRILHPVGFRPGHIVGPPLNPVLQRRVLHDAVECLISAREPLTILEKTYPDYPRPIVKRRFQLWEQRASWKNSPPA